MTVEREDHDATSRQSLRDISQRVDRRVAIPTRPLILMAALQLLLLDQCKNSAANVPAPSDEEADEAIYPLMRDGWLMECTPWQ
jgi:hypothetical protein